jgi:hypothetical protein
MEPKGKTAKMKVIIVGGVAGGASCARRKASIQLSCGQLVPDGAGLMKCDQ